MHTTTVNGGTGLLDGTPASLLRAKVPGVPDPDPNPLPAPDPEPEPGEDPDLVPGQPLPEPMPM